MSFAPVTSSYFNTPREAPGSGRVRVHVGTVLSLEPFIHSCSTRSASFFEPSPSSTELRPSHHGGRGRCQTDRRPPSSQLTAATAADAPRIITVARTIQSLLPNILILRWVVITGNLLACTESNKITAPDPDFVFGWVLGVEGPRRRSSSGSHMGPAVSSNPTVSAEQL